MVYDEGDDDNGNEDDDDELSCVSNRICYHRTLPTSCGRMQSCRTVDWVLPNGTVQRNVAVRSNNK
eukprot:3158997-Karenia_brevis.AAC.1